MKVVLKSSTLRLVLTLPLLILVLSILAGVLADSWLESSGGRQMLQKQLASALGLPVRLEGQYHLKLFPRLEIAGDGLSIGDSEGQGLSASSRKYLAQIEFTPFIHREVRIKSVVMNSGFLEFGDAEKMPGDEKEKAEAAITLPQVASLEIADFFIRVGQAGSGILLRRLQLRDFRTGQAADLDIDAGWLNGGAEILQLKLHGGLNLSATSFSAKLDVQDLSLKLGDTQVEGLTGEWAWDQASSALLGQMDWQRESRTVALHAQLEMATVVSGSVQAQYQGQELPKPASLGFDFSMQPGRLDLSRVNIDMAGQSILGGGCVLLSEPAALQLELQAGELDLDPLYALFPKGSSDSTELPLSLALRLRVDKALLAGAEANQVSVEIGGQPDCSQGVIQAL